MGNWKMVAMLASLLLPAALPQASAQDVGPGVRMIIAAIDHDGDQRVSLNEYLNYHKTRLAQFDANGNGKLSRKEFENSLSERAKPNVRRSFGAFDENGNNALEEREFLGYHAFVFQRRLDANKDDFLDAAELAELGE